jgi:hypothetical protein
VSALTLRLISGPAAGLAVEIDREIVLGREGADVVIADPELSRRHVALRPVGDGVEVEDLGSRNGTFVDGRRISRPERLTATARLGLGESEGSIEIAVAADPDVTARRPVADPEATVKRPAHAAGPPAPPPRTTPSEAAAGRGGPPVALVAGGLLGVVVLAVALVLLLSGDDAEKRSLDLTHTVTTLTKEDRRKSELGPGKQPITWTLVGQTTGQPFGDGNITAITSLQPPGPPPGTPKPAKPPPPGARKKGLVTVNITIRFDNGTIEATERLNNERTGGGIKVAGTGRILRGTGDYEGANGTFEVSGSRPKFRESYETVRWVGSVEY